MYSYETLHRADTVNVQPSESFHVYGIPLACWLGLIDASLASSPDSTIGPDQGHCQRSSGPSLVLDEACSPVE